MNIDACCGNRTRTIAYFAGFIGSFLILVFLVWLINSTRPVTPVASTKIQDRIKNLRDVRAAEALALNQYAWGNQPRGIVNLPVSRAIELTLQEWQDPAAARSNLLARLKQAFPPPPPKAPEKPSEFE